MEKVKAALTKIPETMLTTLWAKAVETDRPGGLLHDEKAKEIIGQIDYDFAKFRKARLSQVGCCIRARLIDDEARQFLALHPDAVVIQLGAGLDARYERLGSPTVSHWFDLDLPEAVALRRRFFTESERNSFLAESMFGEEWIERVQSYGKPVLIILEGVVMYFSQDEIEMLFRRLCDSFPAAAVLFDMLAFCAVGRAKQHDMLRRMDDVAEFRWSLLDTKDMEAWDSRLHVAKEYYMSDHGEGRLPLVIRLLCKIPYCWRRLNQRVVRLEIGR
ncbi:class I SAM-dependent methyltransferase [Prevotella dentasini]|uniref:class I SAM-dependent methyltransferase n=1 Tax=Prevotella dentasini TaxID=589537 RepID=UPI000468F44A|nr:class I SAM-dependent methyltransferase [Prevotella dentasini]